MNGLVQVLVILLCVFVIFSSFYMSVQFINFYFSLSYLVN